MSRDDAVRKIRWRFVLQWSGRLGFLLLVGCGLYLLYDRWTILPTARRLRLDAFMLTGAWWVGQSFYWAVLGETVGWVLWKFVRGFMRRLRGSAGTSATRSKVLAGLGNAWKAGLITLVLLEAASGAVLWLEGRPAALPEGLAATRAREIRIAVMGDSTAAGYPYGAQFSFAAIVGERLAELFPDLHVEVDNVAKPGATFEQAYGLLAELKAKPDVLLVYAGHNEILMRYAVDRVAPRRRLPRWSLLVWLIERRQEAVRQRRYAMQYGGVDNFKLGQRERPLFDEPALTAEQRRAVYANLRRHLEAVVQLCRRQGIVPVLIVPAANESGFEPCRSFLPFGFPQSNERRLRAIYEELARGGVSRQQREVLLDEAGRLCPSFAMTWFLQGRVYEESGRIDEARRAYRRALDCDGFPWHTTAEVGEIYTEVARRWNCALLDAREILRPLSGNGILDEKIFHDVVHPTFAGHAAIADAVLAKLREAGAIRPSGEWPRLVPSDVARLAGGLELRDEVWIRVCRQASLSYGTVPRWHWERDRRLGWSRRYAEAAKAIRDGTPPEETGAPGIGVGRPMARR